MHRLEPKVHDENWTALGMKLPTDTQEIRMMRYLQPTSTAATLNLAAVAAQASRIYKSYHAAFAARCLKAAERAWRAAQKFPRELAPETDNQGGGPYDDQDVSDEFDWAATELFIATGGGESARRPTGAGSPPPGGK